MPEAGASTAIVETRASGVARPNVPAVNTRYPTFVSTGAPTAVTGDQNKTIVNIGIIEIISKILPEHQELGAELAGGALRDR